MSSSNLSQVPHPSTETAPFFSSCGSTPQLTSVPGSHLPLHTCPSTCLSSRFHSCLCLPGTLHSCPHAVLLTSVHEIIWDKHYSVMSCKLILILVISPSKSLDTTNRLFLPLPPENWTFWHYQHLACWFLKSITPMSHQLFKLLPWVATLRLLSHGYFLNKNTGMGSFSFSGSSQTESKLGLLNLPRQTLSHMSHKAQSCGNSELKL